ncbi:hypothetical protein A6M27_03440 [Acidithiobacillus thiooxidans]|uniref:UPF0145 protein A6P07_03225 n=1 Tax=Acidithiobacillus thiooxidans TaxID=930 RepID=A0A1C2JLQ2_ACITH|nr:YbjQ family protein [Acidithiobacillus thiooxidans]OCX76124.1 hypothetical protein A6P07_03225 [Acidithiobacillus thiooxidans]OCX79084.1 hypothetical protein A6O24_02530 [Acidithiobacillus thiooxidans]OCX84970.1 hypothetical protein A6O26_02685 [Acidithiobacillus thiooxidans]OCX89157.1 hypothetical protein A6M27_03440 [Acidithiobacillus thiooxidans]OFC41580.1 hypothetical protein BAE47_17835 [Acidithiobacillus thiooxidans]
MSASTEANSVLILTINDCPGMRIVRVIGPVYGTGVRSRNIVGNFLGGVRAIFGGKQAGYLKMIAQTRDDALEQLAEHTRSLGANAVLGMRFDSGEFDAGQGQAMNEVTAYGTAVVVENP